MKMALGEEMSIYPAAAGATLHFNKGICKKENKNTQIWLETSVRLVVSLFTATTASKLPALTLLPHVLQYLAC